VRILASCRIPFLTQFSLFATPIAYPSSLLHEPRRALSGINPMVGVVEGLRCLLFPRARMDYEVKLDAYAIPIDRPHI
jgi:ABC-type polysaccharide/polyol phosphate export permease